MRFSERAWIVAIVFTGALGPARAHADEPAREVNVDTREIEAELEQRNATRATEERRKAEAARHELGVWSAESQFKERELSESDARLRRAIDTEEGRVVRRSLGGWGLILGGVGSAVGAGLFASALSAKSDVEGGSLATGKDIADARTHTESASAVGVALLGISGVIMITGAILFFTASAPSDGGPKARTHGGLDRESGTFTW